jgi:tetratricopeptide (TPR) repeat protein
LIGAGTAAFFGWTHYQLWAAERALKRYAFDEAQGHLDSYMELRSGDADVHLLAAQIARRRDAYAEAEKHLTAAFQQGGMTETLALERSLLTAQQGNFESVERSLWGRTGPDYPEAVLVLEALAKGYVNHFRQAQTLFCLNLLLEREPNHPNALLARARAWEDRAAHGEKDREEDALHDYEKAVELNPTFEAQLGLAGTLYRTGRVHDALVQYERLYHAQPDNTELGLGLARCCFSVHRVQDAKQLLHKILDSSQDHAGALLELGRIRLHEYATPEAESLLRRAVANSPLYRSEPLRLLCRCLELANKPEESQQFGDELGRREAAVLEVERMTSQAGREPLNVSLRFEIGKKLTALGRDEDGAAALMSVIDLDPRHGPAHEVLADYFERIGRSERALHHRRSASVAGNSSPQNK